MCYFHAQLARPRPFTRVCQSWSRPCSFLLCIHSPFIHQQSNYLFVVNFLHYYQITKKWTTHKPFPVINSLPQVDPFLWVCFNLVPGLSHEAIFTYESFFSLIHYFLGDVLALFPGLRPISHHALAVQFL